MKRSICETHVRKVYQMNIISLETKIKRGGRWKGASDIN